MRTFLLIIFSEAGHSIVVKATDCHFPTVGSVLSRSRSVPLREIYPPDVC